MQLMRENRTRANLQLKIDRNEPIHSEIGLKYLPIWIASLYKTLKNLIEGAVAIRIMSFDYIWRDRTTINNILNAIILWNADLEKLYPVHEKYSRIAPLPITEFSNPEPYDLYTLIMDIKNGNLLTPDWYQKSNSTIIEWAKQENIMLEKLRSH